MLQLRKTQSSTVKPFPVCLELRAPNAPVFVNLRAGRISTRACAKKARAAFPVRFLHMICRFKQAAALQLEMASSSSWTTHVGSLIDWTSWSCGRTGCTATVPTRPRSNPLDCLTHHKAQPFNPTRNIVYIRRPFRVFPTDR